MFDNAFMLPKDTTRIWDLDVPIIDDTEHKLLYIYLTDEINIPFNYSEACHRLINLSDDYTVIIYMNTPGGVVSTGLMLVDAINRTKAWVIGDLVGDVASVGTIISMACDELRISPELTFMIHNYSGGMFGKGNEMKARQNFVDDHLNKTFRKYYQGFLTEEEIDKVIEGTDMWMGAEEVQNRWNNKLQGQGKLT